MKLKTRLTLITASLAFASLATVPALAVGRPAGAGSESETNVNVADANSGAAAEHQASAQARLAGAKLKSCQNREKAIDNIMSRIADRGQKQLNLFTSIADRTEKFYTDKGKTLSNYDALVADVNAKEIAAQTTINTVKADKVTFKCDGSDPKGAATSFKADLKGEIAALKAYKTSVKNLIVGVKSVQGTTSSSNGTTTGEQQ